MSLVYTYYFSNPFFFPHERMYDEPFSSEASMVLHFHSSKAVALAAAGWCSGEVPRLQSGRPLDHRGALCPSNSRVPGLRVWWPDLYLRWFMRKMPQCACDSGHVFSHHEICFCLYFHPIRKRLWMLLWKIAALRIKSEICSRRTKRPWTSYGRSRGS